MSMDESGHIVEFNQAASRIFGYPRHAGRGPGTRRAHHSAGDCAKRIGPGLRRYLAGGSSALFGRLAEFEALRADGSRVPIELSVAEVPMPQGRLFTGIMRDVSERKTLPDPAGRQLIASAPCSPAISRPTWWRS